MELALFTPPQSFNLGFKSDALNRNYAAVGPFQFTDNAEIFAIAWLHLPLKNG
jgi:hypothetical protein